MIVAADHPARGALAARGNPTAMGSRQDLLERLATALARPGVDGVLGTADILDDLLLMGALENKVVVGSMNAVGWSAHRSSSTTGSPATPRPRWLPAASTAARP